MTQTIASVKDSAHLEEIVDALDRAYNETIYSIMIEFFGEDRRVKISGYGVQPNGYYIELEAWSPENYNTKFAIFDQDICKFYNKNRHLITP